MAENMGVILKLPPEIFPLIASHLPLQSLPATLFSLTLTCRAIHSYVHAVLHRRIIIKDEDHACNFFERISMDATLGPLIREFHLRIDLPVEMLKKRGKSTVLLKLQEVIEKGSLPYLIFCQLVLLRDDDIESTISEFEDQYSLRRSFWETLRRRCPLLQGLTTHGVSSSPEGEWIDDPNFYDLKDFLGLSTFTFKFYHGYPRKECSEKLCRNILNLSSSLQSLSLFLKGYEAEAGPLLSLMFPQLKSFTISGIKSTTEQAMLFWTRHPNLERVNIYEQRTRWFSNSVEGGLLPRLRHLRAQFDDVRALATHLGQLEHLSITKSYNCQIPYLLRCVIPMGLPDLKSLEIHQEPSKYSSVLSLEGAEWSETEDGQFIQATTPDDAWKFITSSYIQSIARGAPNLQELYVGSFIPYRKSIREFAPIMGQLRSLERFYYRVFDLNIRAKDWSITSQHCKKFKTDCRLLGHSCRSLRIVTDVSFFTNGPYIVGNILRGAGGSVKSIAVGRGFGMESTGGEDDPFPLNKSPTYDSYDWA